MATFALWIERPEGDLPAVFERHARDAGLAPSKAASATGRIALEVGKTDAIALVHGACATRTLVEAVAAELAENAARTTLVFVDVPGGQRGDGVTTWASVFEGDTHTSDDEVQETAEEILSDWQQEGTVYDEYEAELQLARDLLDAPSSKRKSLSLPFAQGRMSRAAPFLAAIAAGERIDFVTLTGRRGVKMKLPDGSARTAFLDDAELAEIETALASAR